MKAYRPLVHNGSLAHKLLGMLVEDGARPYRELRTKLGGTASAFTEIVTRLMHRGLVQDFYPTNLERRLEFRHLAMTAKGLHVYEALEIGAREPA